MAAHKVRYIECVILAPSSLFALSRAESWILGRIWCLPGARSARVFKDFDILALKIADPQGLESQC